MLFKEKYCCCILHINRSGLNHTRYPVIYVVANPVRGHKEVPRSTGHIDSPLLKPTGIQIATKSYATLQAMAPTNNKTVHQTSFTPYREQPRSTRIVVAYPRPAFSATNRTNTFQPVLINNSKFLKATHRTKTRKIERPRSMVVVCVCCVFFPFILDIKFVGRTSRSHTGGRSHRISHPPSFCGASLNFSREKDSAVPFPRRPRNRILCTNDLIVLHPLGILILFFRFLVRKSRLPGSNSRPNVSEGYEVPLSYRGDRPSQPCT